jgi:hypothetical protein
MDFKYGNEVIDCVLVTQNRDQIMDLVNMVINICFP